MKTIRVLQMVGSISAGGMESVIMNYYRNIDRDRIQFDFLVREPECRSSFHQLEIEHLGGNIYRISTDSIIDKLLFIFRLYLFFKNHKYTIVHSHMDVMSVIYLFVSLISGIPNRISHSHNTSYEHNKKALIKMMLKPFINAVSTYRMACGIEAAKWLYGEKNIVGVKILNNAIDVNRFHFDKEVRTKLIEKMNLESKIIIGHVGHFVYQKNHKFLIDVFYQMTKLSDKVVLLLIGDGVLRDCVLHQIENLGIADRVIFLGQISDVYNYLNVMDIFLFPSNYEGLPLALVEAQASGLLIFASENVPSSVKYTESLYFLPLEESSASWASKILRAWNVFSRVDNSDIAKAHGFDIRTNSLWLQNFYLTHA